MYEVCLTREFCAAHFLRDYDGKCANLHGHNWKVALVYRRSGLSDNGILVDFHDCGAVLDEILERMDHRIINDIPPFDHQSPTAENLAEWFFQEVSNHTAVDSPRPYRVTVWETESSSASYWED